VSTVVDGTPARATIDGVPPEPLEPRGNRGNSRQGDGPANGERGKRANGEGDKAKRREPSVDTNAGS